MAVKFGKVFRTVVAGRQNMNDFSMVTVGSPLQLFETVTFGKCDAEFPLEVNNGIATTVCRLQIDEEDDQVVEAIMGTDPAETNLSVDICRDKETVDEDALFLVLAVANDRKTAVVDSIEQAVGWIRNTHISPVQMVQVELGDGRIFCAKAGTFLMPCCGIYRGFVCLNTNDVCVVKAPELLGG